MRLVLLSFGAILAMASCATANIIYDNVSAAGINLVPVLQNPYASFSSAGGSSLTALELVMIADQPDDGGSFNVGLYADSGTNPGALLSLLATVNDSSLTAWEIYDIPLSSTPALSAGRYWIGLSSSASSARWSYTFDTDSTGVPGQYHVYENDAYYPVDDETNFYYRVVIANTDIANYDGGPFQMQVTEGAAAPPPAPATEPATGALLAGAAGVGLGLWRRRAIC